MHALAVDPGHVAPGLLGREREDGGEEPGERGEHLEAHCLRRPPPQVVRRRDVEPVLDDVEVEGGQVHGAEVVRRVEHHVELVIAVGAAHARDQLAEAQERPAIQLLEPIVGHAIPLGVEVREGAEEEAARVADAPILVGEAIEDLVGETDVLRVVLRRHP